MHRRAFLGAAVALAGAPALAAEEPQSIWSTAALDAYARRLQAALDRSGGGRMVFESEADLFDAHQQIRREHGLPEFAPHHGLQLAARAHAADQSVRGYFAHVSPDGYSVPDRVGLLARTFLGLPGENIIDVRGNWLGASPQRMIDGWMDSPGHRENILRRRFTHLGLGVVQTGRRTVAGAVFGERFAELEDPIPLRPTAGEIDKALETASPAIHSYGLSPVGRTELAGAFDLGERPAGLRAGPYTLRPRLQDGSRYTVVMGPIVELTG